MPKQRIEEQNQVAFVSWFRIQYPQYSDLLTLGSFGENIGARRMSRLKQMGYTPGYPDLVLHAPFIHRDQFVCKFGLFIEMKTKDGIVSKKQHEIHEALIERGYAVRIARDWEEAKEIMQWYIEACESSTFK